MVRGGGSCRGGVLERARRAPFRARVPAFPCRGREVYGQTALLNMAAIGFLAAVAR